MDARHAAGEPRLLISRKALLHNAAVLRRRLHPSVRLCAILKADAYGHGAVMAADALTRAGRPGEVSTGADAIAVASIDEAAALGPINVPVLIFRPVENAFVAGQRSALESAINENWVLTLCSPSAAEDVARIALATGRRASVQVMIDTGMTRSGVDIAALPELLRRIESRPSLRLAGLCTHFACADEPRHPFTVEQLERFKQATDPAAQFTPGRFLRHAANSGAIFFNPDAHLDMVRPGIALYGIDPTGRPNMDRHLRPVMKWVAPLLMIRPVAKGAGVGYGQSWIAPRDTYVGLAPVGYADGYLRRFSPGAVMRLNDRIVPVIGRVSMDLTTVDLGPDPDAAVGDDVTLLDDDPLSPCSVYALAKWADTIPYEIFCRIGSRIRRVCVDDETSHATTDSQEAA